MFQTGWMRELTRALLDFAYPRICLICGSALHESEKFEVCDVCHREVSGAKFPRCQICSGTVGPYLNTVNGCADCSKSSFAFQSVQSLGPYEEPLRGAILRTKTGSDSALTSALTDLLWSQEKERLSSLGVDLIVPVPHHWIDRIVSPRPPVELIAERLGGFLMVPVEHHILRKHRRTPKQRTMETVTQRRQNLRAAFTVPKQAILDGAHILLVDDVLTTGTTCQRVSSELKKAGASRVDVVVIARHVSQQSQKSDRVTLESSEEAITG
ncbi:phosphoribosyltransferase family protein [Thalassoglobus sp. JC818]|uniref:ComF family protein n=1 Tax=Thalassoglobus sp. JC818 TaxID=3232136 RepID=UPI00345A32C0